MLLGGAYVPVLLFPGWLKALSLWLPFGGFTSVAQAFHTSFDQRWFVLLSSQIAWIGILLLVVWYMYRRATKIVSINGG
jgi:ABC-2 type transport system permease protein